MEFEINREPWSVSLERLLDRVELLERTNLSAATVTSVGNIPNLPSTTRVVRMNNATDATIQGIAPGVAGQQLRILSVGAGNVLLAHADTGAVVGSRLTNLFTSRTTPLAAGKGFALYEYDAISAVWRLISYEQGAWLSQTFAAGDFTANGSMTWTVDEADVVTNAYYYSGITLLWSVAVITSTVGGTPASTLRLASTGLGTLTPRTSIIVPNSNNAVANFGRNAYSGTNMTWLRDKDSGVWDAAANNTSVSGLLTFSVL